MALAIPKNTVTQLVKNYFASTQKLDTATNLLRPLDSSLDSYTFWFAKTDIDSLFSANSPAGNPVPNDQLGLRVYLGMHANSAIEQTVAAYVEINGGLSQPFANYNGQHCVILVATLKDAGGVNNDLLDNNNTVNITMQQSMALEFGGICPPPATCGGVTVLPD